MTHLNNLHQQLRLVISEVFYHDVRFENIVRISTNSQARVFLRHVIRTAIGHLFNFEIRFDQLARLIGVTRKSFIQWFVRNVRLPVIFRRVRWFLNDEIYLDAHQRRQQRYALINSNVQENPVEMPDEETMAEFRRRTQTIREEKAREGPRMTNLQDAEELVEVMLDAISQNESDDSAKSQSSTSEDDENDKSGEDPVDCFPVVQQNYSMDESSALNGRPVIVSNEQLSDEFGKLNVADNINDIDNMPIYAQHQ